MKPAKSTTLVFEFADPDMQTLTIEDHPIDKPAVLHEHEGWTCEIDWGGYRVIHAHLGCFWALKDEYFAPSADMAGNTVLLVVQVVTPDEFAKEQLLYFARRFKRFAGRLMHETEVDGLSFDCLYDEDRRNPFPRIQESRVAETALELARDICPPFACDIVQACSSELQSSRGLLKAAVSVYSSSLLAASKVLQCDEELVVHALAAEDDSLTLPHVNPVLQTNLHVVRVAVKHAKAHYKDLSDELKQDHDIVMWAIWNTGGFALQHAPEQVLRDIRAVQAAINYDLRPLRNVPKDFLCTHFADNPRIMSYVSERT